MENGPGVYAGGAATAAPTITYNTSTPIDPNM
jgi:hypothetical protein